MRRVLSQYGVALAFMTVALFGGVAIKEAGDRSAESLRASQVKSCERVNVIRKTLGEFLENAAAARHAEGDHETAEAYEKHLANMRAVEHTPGDSVQVICEKAVGQL